MSAFTKLQQQKYVQTRRTKNGRLVSLAGTASVKENRVRETLIVEAI